MSGRVTEATIDWLSDMNTFLDSINRPARPQGRHMNTMKALQILLRAMALGAITACSAGGTAPEAAHDALTPDDGIVTTEGPLKLTVTDAPAQPGVLFAAGTVEGGHGVVTISSTRYGSLCATSITAHADTAAGRITLRVDYSERLTVCIASIRSITYRAEIGGLAAGGYEVSVIHTNPDASTGTVLTKHIDVE